MTHKSRVAVLRQTLKKMKLTGLIVPRQDEFQGEYVAAYAERLRWLTGFAGSWGMAILTLKKGAIFVDGRYTIQVRQQVDTKLFTPHHLIDDPPAAWIADNLKKGDVLGFDPWLLTADQAERFTAACAKVGAKLVAGHTQSHRHNLGRSTQTANCFSLGSALAVCRPERCRQAGDDFQTTGQSRCRRHRTHPA